MFMSTVVYFVEFAMLSLLGFMLYRLYTSYAGWKKSSSYPQAKSNLSVKPLEEINDLALDPEKLDYLAVKNIYVTEEIAKSQNHESKNDKKSSAILNDYIGEFFSESLPVDIDHFRSQPSVNSVKTTLSQSSVAQNTEQCLEQEANLSSRKLPISDSSRENLPEGTNVSNSKIPDDEIILVSSFNVKHQESESHNAKEGRSLGEDMIPTLRELNDIDTDTIITVDTLSEEQKNNSKVMSDKVVLAMLDEAKLVCAS